MHHVKNYGNKDTTTSIMRNPPYIFRQRVTHDCASISMIVLLREFLGSVPGVPRYAFRRFLIASVNCAAVRGRETVKTWKAWDDSLETRP